MKKLFKILGILTGSIIGLLLLIFVILYISINIEIPEGTPGEAADNFAQKILTAVQHDNYKNTRYIQWTFRNKNHYVWDRSNEMVEVKWGYYATNLNLNTPKESKVTKNGTTLESTEKQEIIAKALKNFHNDSFWVVAPHKLFDKGSTRKLIDLEDGSQGLLVSYSSGGTTPGDTYLWKVNQDFIPTSYLMWVSIIPIGGIEASWEDWNTTESGTLLPGKHKLLGLDIPISDVKGWN